MSEKLAKASDPSTLVKEILATGDLRNLSDAKRAEYYFAMCELYSLNPLTQPFDFIRLKDGTIKLYANKSCTDQLRENRKASARISDVRFDAGLIIVFSETSTPDGRITHQIGSVSMRGSAEDKANALMKAVTKAFRRGMLTHCGLSILDQTETETIPGAQVIEAPKQITEGEKEGW